jgi:hypothetical protein
VRRQRSELGCRWEPEAQVRDVPRLRFGLHRHQSPRLKLSHDTAQEGRAESGRRAVSGRLVPASLPISIEHHVSRIRHQEFGAAHRPVSQRRDIAKLDQAPNSVPTMPRAAMAAPGVDERAQRYVCYCPFRALAVCSQGASRRASHPGNRCPSWDRASVAGRPVARERHNPECRWFGLWPIAQAGHQCFSPTSNYDLRLPTRRHPDVPRTQVPVEEPLVVHCFHTACDARNEQDRSRNRPRPAN